MSRETLRWVQKLLSRLFRRRHQETALETEMRFHFEQLVDQFRAEGMSESDARRAARREFGTVDAYREEVRDSWRPPALAELWRSVRFAVRGLARSPGFTLIAILTLALGIGANTSMFSIVNGIVIKPLPYTEADELECLFRQTSANPNGPVSATDYLDFREATTTYQSISAHAYDDISVAEPGQPAEFAEALRVSANFFGHFGILPNQGRTFEATEETFGNHRVAIISHRYWQNHLGARADLVGRRIRINGEPHEVVGILPEVFNDWRHLGWVDVFRPLAFTTDELNDRGSPFIELIGRRATHASAADTAGEVKNHGLRLATQFPGAHAESSWRTLPLSTHIMGPSAKFTLSMLVGLSGFVLLIACSNLANFLLARTMARSREFAVRSALGASRAQLLRPLLLESFLLALAGGVLALLVAMWFTDWLALRSTGDNGDQVLMSLDWRVLGWALLAALATAVAFSLAPALFALRLNLNATLKSGARGATGGPSQNRLRHLLIVGQFTLAMVLLTGAALFIHGLDDLNHRRSGWDSDQLLTGTFLLPEADYASPTEINAFQRRTLERLRTLPGVTTVGLATHPPFFNWSESRRFIAEGQEPPVAGREPAAMINAVTPDYLPTVGTSLISGRFFDERDQLESSAVLVINQSMAAALFPQVDPIGRRLARVTENGLEWGEVVGVVADVRNVLPEAVTVPFQLYVPMAQEPRTYNEIAVRTRNGDPATLVTAVRAIMTELDPDLPIRNLKPAEDRVFRANYQLGVLRDMLTGFALLGLGLATLGIYGVIARTMAQRTGEFGIRIALGAEVSHIVRLVLGSGIRLALIGAVLGAFGGLGISKLLAMGFPNMRLENPWVLAAAVATLITVALLACYLPARRASRINPVDTLRSE